MQKFVIIETERTLMRELIKEDAEDFYNLNLDKEVLKFTGDQSFKSIEAARDFLINYDQYRKYGVGRLAVLDKNLLFLGWCGLRYDENRMEYDIGFRFYKNYWNRGFATETAKKCLEYYFEKFKMPKIVGKAMQDNIASIKVLEKIGMTFKGNFDFNGGNGVIYEVSNQTGIN